MARDHLSDHEYDGIREYDNPTPGWWHLIFAATAVFSLLYFVYFHFNSKAPTPHTRLAKKQMMEDKKLFGALGELEPTEATFFKLMGDSKLMSVAQATFTGNCASCHARDGGGINGVNLTDNHYKNVKAMPDLYKVITEGAAGGAMPAQANYSKNERILLAAYAASLRGTKPATPKAPEGVEIEPWPKAAVATQ